jgi:alpha-galactosidase
MKLVFIGAGSMSFGIPMFRDIFVNPMMAGSTLALVDIDPENLDRMTRLAHRMNEVSGLGLKVVASADRRSALRGAHFVVSSIAIERCELWKKDFLIPKRYGVRHCLGENGGPGALFFGMRTIPVVMDIVRDMEELCPEAYFLNFSNPETRIVLAVSKYSKIKCIGLCHGVFMTLNDLAKMLNRAPDSMKALAAGMNHFQWLIKLQDARTGKNLYPELAEADRTFDPAFEPYTRRMYRAFGLWPTCSDTHLGEYQAYGYEAGEQGYDFDGDARDRVQTANDIERAVRGEANLAEWLTPSGEKAVEVITSLYFDQPKIIPSAIVYNDGAISNLPGDIAVEVPVAADGTGIHKFHIGEVPLAVKNLMNLQVGPQQLAVEAAVRGSKEIALQALLCDPVTNSCRAAMALLDELWEANKEYIRYCL